MTPAGVPWLCREYAPSWILTDSTLIYNGQTEDDSKMHVSHMKTDKETFKIQNYLGGRSKTIAKSTTGC